MQTSNRILKFQVSSTGREQLHFLFPAWTAEKPCLQESRPPHARLSGTGQGQLPIPSAGAREGRGPSPAAEQHGAASSAPRRPPSRRARCPAWHSRGARAARCGGRSEVSAATSRACAVARVQELGAGGSSLVGGTDLGALNLKPKLWQLIALN